MYFRPYMPWPALPAEPSGAQYFWHQLPWGLPGLLSLLVGVLLFAAAFREAVRRPERRKIFIYLAIVSLVMGLEAARTALHALVPPGEFARRASMILFVCSIPLGPAVVSLFHEMTDRKYRFLPGVAALLWLIALVSMALIVRDGLFLEGGPERTVFGIRYRIRPRENLLILIRILITGLVVLPLLWKHFGLGPGMRRGLMVGGLLVLFIFLGNVITRFRFPTMPSFTALLFLPLLFLGYDAFRSYLRDLNRLLFEELGLFYLLNLLLAVLFVAMSMTVSFGLSPGEYRDPKWFTLVPALAAAGSVFALGILVAGMNPREPVHQYAATYAYCMAFVMLLYVFPNKGLEPIVFARLCQLAWLIIPWSLSVFPRFVYLSLELSPPRWLVFADIVAAGTCLLALSPWTYPGFYTHSFGVFPAVGPVLFIWSLAALIVYGLLSRDFLRVRGRITGLNRMAVVGIMVLLLGLWSSFPSSMGFVVPPAGIFTVFPAALLGFITIRKRAMVASAIAYRLNGRLTSLVAIVSPLSMLVVLSLLLRENRIELGLLHLALVSAPLVLFAYQLTHFLSRPVTEQLARSFDDQLDARAEAEQARRDAESARRESDELNQLSRRMTELKFLDDILDEIFRYIRRHYACEHISLIFIDGETEEFYVHRSLHPEHFSGEEKKFADSFRAPSSRSGGIYWFVHERNRLVYLPEVTEPPTAAMDRIFYRRLSYRSLLVAPLLLRGEVVGLFSMMNYIRPMDLSPEDVRGLGRLCDQATGAIHNSYLWRESELARHREEEARREAEGIRRGLEEEMRMASRIQESLLPQEIPEPPEARIAYRFAPMLAVGGDFLDLHYAPEHGRLGFFICDVSGHGVSAAFVASMVKMALRNWDKHLLRPAEILNRIQDRLREKMAGHTLTACVGCLDLSSGHIRMATAGHPPPVLIAGDGGVSLLEVGGRLVMDHPLWQGEREEKDFHLERGDKLLLFTDGLLEARSPQGWMLGEDKLLAWLGRNQRPSPDDLCRDLQHYIQRYTGGLELDDDFTILAIEYRGPSSEDASFANAPPGASDASE